jgi:hypothetical protein
LTILSRRIRPTERDKAVVVSVDEADSNLEEISEVEIVVANLSQETDVVLQEVSSKETDHR